ncbi:MAG: SIS domain-containing protein [Syntrophales bacterium]|nr:SIS domain-containing protein [Syntrophales bacterium]
MIYKKIEKVFRFIKSWSIYIGCDPGRVVPPAVILFPLLPGVLSCGIVGILHVKRPLTSNSKVHLEKFSETFKKALCKGFHILLNGTTSVDQYLGGDDILRELEESYQAIKSDVSFESIIRNEEMEKQLKTSLQDLNTFITSEEKNIDNYASGRSTSEMELINSRLSILRDIAWGLEYDVLDNKNKIISLAGAHSINEISSVAFHRYHRLNLLLNSLDRLEVRGRDSAGVEISFSFKDKVQFETIINRLKDKGLWEEFINRSRPGDLLNYSISLSIDFEDGRTNNHPISVSFVYKTWSVVGSLGKNVQELRTLISRDDILKEFANFESENEVSFAHTRWASVGAITEENCHPVNNYTFDKLNGWKYYPHYGYGRWSIEVILNGDIDNYPALRRDLEKDEELINPSVTTDTKIIPLLIEKYLQEGLDLEESFRSAVSAFEGSHAIAMISNIEPGKAFLALRGSGQAIYVGLTPDGYIFASELYGIVELTQKYIKLNGELTPPGKEEPMGQIFVLEQDGEGGIKSIKSFFYDGTPFVLEEKHIEKAEITTRDIDRRGYPHYFLKEIHESSKSVSKTLKGRYRFTRNKIHFNFGEDILPQWIEEKLLKKHIRNIFIIGHGTAAVAGMAVAEGMNRYLKGSGLKIEAKVASELSGFMDYEEMKVSLIIPITQSGTTTDTNRAVALSLQRGAAVVAIVNRRQSDITHKSHGVFYTSDGRDIEMSVASTKAYYSQIAAGHLLGLYFAQLLGTMTDDAIVTEINNLERAPMLMEILFERKDLIRESATKLAKRKRYWAVVGSGPNKIAADEIRIKLSELCYKTISSDIIENKKHIDLSAEPLVLVCAAGTPETVLSDIAKDVAIFKAHKSHVVVFADEGDDRFDEFADYVIPIPKASVPTSIILNTMAGHLWGYYAASSIDEEASFLKEFRNKLEISLLNKGKRPTSFFEKIMDRKFRQFIMDYNREINRRRLDGAFTLATSQTLTDVVLLLKYAMGKIPLEEFWSDFGTEETSPIERLDLSLGQIIDELTRPIDAIRHQAKTVTVGTSRKEYLPSGIIFDLIKQLSFTHRSLTTRNVLDIKRVQPAIRLIRGYTLYSIDNLDIEGNPTETSTIKISKRDGISLQLRSRTETSPHLMGTKRTIVSTKHIYIGKGKQDGFPIVIIPLLGDTNKVSHLLLVHVTFNEELPLHEKIAVLGYKFNDIKNTINEYNLNWRDNYISQISVEDLLCEPAELIATRIKETMDNKQTN